jgi:hypothetical protein
MSPGRISFCLRKKNALSNINIPQQVPTTSPNKIDSSWR